MSGCGLGWQGTDRGCGGGVRVLVVGGGASTVLRRAGGEAAGAASARDNGGGRGGRHTVTWDDRGRKRHWESTRLTCVGARTISLPCGFRSQRELERASNPPAPCQHPCTFKPLTTAAPTQRPAVLHLHKALSGSHSPPTPRASELWRRPACTRAGIGYSLSQGKRQTKPTRPNAHDWCRRARIDTALVQTDTHPPNKQHLPQLTPSYSANPSHYASNARQLGPDAAPFPCETKCAAVIAKARLTRTTGSIAPACYARGASQGRRPTVWSCVPFRPKPDRAGVCDAQDDDVA